MGSWKSFLCPIMPSVSGTDQYCFRGKGVCARYKFLKCCKVIDFNNLLKVSQELLATIA